MTGATEREDALLLSVAFFAPASNTACPDGFVLSKLVNLMCLSRSVAFGTSRISIVPAYSSSLSSVA